MSKNAVYEVKNSDVCPDCGANLVIRSGKHGPFLRCETYPACHHIRSLSPQSDGHIVKVLDGQLCPQCGDVLVLRQGRYGMFIGCSAYPNCEHISVIDKPDETNIACPDCKKGALLQRKSRFGKIFHACDQYPKCKFALNNKPVSGRCDVCGYGLLMEKKTANGIIVVCANKSCGKAV